MPLSVISIQKQIYAAAIKYNRDPTSIKLLAVTKGQSVETIKEAIAAGLRSFGESYIQESLPKIAALQNFYDKLPAKLAYGRQMLGELGAQNQTGLNIHEDSSTKSTTQLSPEVELCKMSNLEWHFIGPIQGNKTKPIAENFSWVHSISRAKIAQRINDQRPQTLPPLNVCIEVNISAETNKQGIDILELPQLTSDIVKLPKLKLRGLMAIPEHTKDFTKQRENFRKLAKAMQQLNSQGYSLDTLSMGMSDDFVAALAEGATILRLGHAIFTEQ